MCVGLRVLDFTSPRYFSFLPATAFNEIRSKPGGHELSVRINVLPLAQPDASLESRIEEADSVLAGREGSIFRQASKFFHLRAFGGSMVSRFIH